ncbi:aminotransferase class V-fold PLP-dependent enzyme [Gordonia sp. TBRC 11910]|uniref:Aminotransferase class V-fold PLP-dependent enzyme n=1 Tax=Gordonia asplenii TaxID=2725283 RepID=A0A848KT33_9ACTN|nr:aminotransferase class V-fold PLP-dependent enzyme [Gordonia asplenii]NMN99662.1 aminotransferase class V-fold PLP-dependent enzyme [Gordonia asplenii]
MTSHVPDTHVSPVWGDEAPIVADVVGLISRRITRSSDPKTTARTASELAADAGTTITAAGLGSAQALRIFEDVLAPATRAQDDPYNLAYIPAAPTQAARAFDAAVSSFNIFAGTWEAGAGAIFAENEALGWLIDLLGWPSTAGGCFVSGGTMGNLSALVAARSHVRHLRGRDAAGAILCTVDAHSSISAAARVMDVEVVLVDEDDRGHLTGTATRAALAEHPEVFAVVASSGTTNGGVVDDIADLADVCEEFQIWLHVDGAYGGAGLAAPSVRDRFDGIERAHSFVVDPHKWLFAPYDCCALLYRDVTLARAAHAQHASYLDLIDREAWNPADLAIHLSRRARGLPLWFSLAVYGTDRYTEAIERTVATARAIAHAIDECDWLRLLLAPELSVLVFDRPGWSDDDYNRWSSRLAREGLLLCVPTRWKGQTALRLAIVNPATQAQHTIDVLRETTAQQPD